MNKQDNSIEEILDRFEAGADPEFSVEIRYARTKEETAQQIQSLISEAYISGAVAELEGLNLYYLRHDGEGEHKLAAHFDKRLSELRKEERA